MLERPGFPHEIDPMMPSTWLSIVPGVNTPLFPSPRVFVFPFSFIPPTYSWMCAQVPYPPVRSGKKAFGFPHNAQARQGKARWPMNLIERNLASVVMGQGSQLCKAASISCDPFFVRHEYQLSCGNWSLGTKNLCLRWVFHFIATTKLKWIISDKSTSCHTKLSVTKVGAMCWHH